MLEIYGVWVGFGLRRLDEEEEAGYGALYVKEIMACNQKRCHLRVFW